VTEPHKRPTTGSGNPQGPENTEAGGSNEQRLPADQGVSDVDQTVSDSDQTASDSDQTASDRDQSQADSDQRTSNRDQAAADSEHAARYSGGETNDIYEAARADRLAGTLERAETGRARARTAAERLEHAAWRDQSAQLRDLSASARDRAAELRDITAARLEQEAGLAPVSAEIDRGRATDARALAAAERARAGADREHAAADRTAAERDREEARAELRQAQLDPLTGAFGRELGMAVLEHEMNRARHGNGSLVLAFADVDELKRVNDSRGHAAGDALLRNVVAAMREHLRSYDPIVRIGGDEFVCALVDCTPDQAECRFHEIHATIKQSQPAGSISVGFAALRPEDTLKQLTQRGDADLYAVKWSR
jgi:diguanylate cyclase (GGDEF)-like protein